MPSFTFTFAQDFKGQLGLAKHNLDTDTHKYAFSNTTPNLGTMTTLSQITEIGTSGGYTAGGGGVAVTTSYSQSGGTGTFVANDASITASGGSIGPFRYVWLYNDTQTSPADPLIGYLDYGSAITVADGETFTVDTGASLFTLA